MSDSDSPPLLEPDSGPERALEANLTEPRGFLALVEPNLAGPVDATPAVADDVRAELDQLEAGR